MEEERMNEVPLILSKLPISHWIKKGTSSSPMQDKQHNSRDGPPAGKQEESTLGSSRGRSDSVHTGWRRAWRGPVDPQAGCTEDSPKELVKTSNPGF